MAEDFRRHDISDRMWTLLQPHLPGRKGSSGRNARDNRQFINAVIWILRTDAQDPGFEWLIIDASYIKVHTDGTGAI